MSIRVEQVLLEQAIVRIISGILSCWLHSQDSMAKENLLSWVEIQYVCLYLLVV
jgi:hypothetical protein